MRIRSTKPEFWRSKTISEGLTDWADRLVLKGIESYVDDNGVGKDDLALFAADVFPRDLSANPRETLARLTEAISRIVSVGLVVRYEVDGEKLIYVDKWKDIQRVDKPNRGRFPRPDGTFEYSEPVDRDSYRNPRETLANPPEILAPVTGEQGNRGTEEQNGGSGSQVWHQSVEAVPPQDRCPRHMNVANPPSCGACADARRNADQWHADRKIAEQREADRREQRRQEILDAIRECGDCDDLGRIEIDDALKPCPNHAQRKDIA